MFKRFIKRLFHDNQRGDVDIGLKGIIIGVITVAIVIALMPMVTSSNITASRAYDYLDNLGYALAAPGGTFTGDIDSVNVTADNLNAPTGRTATYVIAASNATDTEKAQADLKLNGTNDGAAITAFIASLPGPTVVWTNNIQGGVHIAFSSGTVFIETPVTLNRPAIKISGQGIGNTTFKLMDGANCDVFQCGTTALASGLRAITFEDFSIDGRNGTNTIGNGINFSNVTHSFVSRVFADHLPESGFYCNGGVDLVYFDHCTASCSTEYGWECITGNQLYLSDCYVLLSAATKSGYYFNASQAIYMSGCTYDGGTGATGTGIYSLGSSYINIGDCDIYGVANGKYGIDLQGNFTSAKIHGCDLRGQAGASVGIGCTLWATTTVSDLSIKDNRIDSTFNIGVYIPGGGGGGATLNRFEVEANNIQATTPFYPIDTALITTVNNLLVENNIGYIHPGEVRTASGSLTAGNANAFAIAWHNPEAQDIMVTKVVIVVATGGGTVGSLGQIGIADNATGTNLGSEFFTALTLNNTGTYDSYIAGDTGAQTKWLLLQDSASGTDGWLDCKITVQNAASLVGSYYIEYVGK
jgi:hypothetical protein